MPLAYVPPEVAFEVRIQCTEKQIQRHCDADPENDRRDFDDQGGLQVPVYHTYADNIISGQRTYWYTFDEAEGEDNEFDIRDLPTFSLKTLSHQDMLQGCLDRRMVRINNNKLTTVGGE